MAHRLLWLFGSRPASSLFLLQDGDPFLLENNENLITES